MPPFQTRPTEPRQVDAIQLRGPCRLGKQKGRSGDYLVTHDDQTQEIIGQSAFESAYEPSTNGGAPIALAPRRAAPAGKPAKAEKKKAGDGAAPRARDPENVAAEAAAKKLWEQGIPVKEIARTVKKSTTMIYNWSSKGKWQRPKPGTAASPAGVGAKQLSGQVKCTSCTLWTSTDPCEKCGAKLKSGW